MPVNFNDQFERQLRRLERATNAFDRDADWDAAIDMAVALRVIFHQGPRSDSLITLMGNPEISLLSTIGHFTPDDYTVTYQGMCLTTMDLEHGIFLSPALDDGPPINDSISFKQWWGQLIWVHTPHSLSRRDLVLKATNKDGGAHVAKNLPEDYESMSIGGSGIGFHAENTETGKVAAASYEDAHLCSLRQICWEVLNSSDVIQLRSNSDL